jgi:DNA-binding transcriptional LysR family regulator
MLNVGRLRLLRELALRGSISAVADALWLTPSAVSQQLAVLERETQVQLLDRSGRGVRLTAAGRVLAERSEPVFAALDAAEAALRSLDAEPVGSVRVAAFPSVVRVVLPPVIAALRERHPGLRLEVEDLEAEQSLHALDAGRLDVAIVDDLAWGSGSAARARLDEVELRADPLGAVLPPGHRLEGAERIEWSALAGEPWVMEHQASLFSRTVVEECRRAGFEPRIHARVHDLSAMLALVDGGYGICVLPQLAVIGAPHAERWRPLDPAVHRRLLAVTRLGRPAVPGVHVLVAELLSAAAGLDRRCRSGDAA